MKLLNLLVFLFLGLNGAFGQIYLNDFGTASITTKPYTGIPTTFAANLSNSSWTTSASGWSASAGSAGMSLSLTNSGGTPTYTLTFDVASGYKVDITDFNFWRVRSATGAQNWAMKINGTSVGSGTIPTSGAAIGSTAVSSAITGLTGTITVILTMSGATGTGTFRLDDFTLYGSVTSNATPSIAISAAHPSAANITNGSNNNIIGGIKLDVTSADATLTGVSFTTSGNYTAADIATNGFKFWLSTSATSIVGATQLGAAQAAAANGSVISVSSLSSVITSASTKYILLTANINASATANRTISITSTAFSNITFSAGTKTGTDPVATSNTQTIIIATPNIAVSSNHPSAGTINQNTTNQNIASLAFAVTTADATLNSITFTTAGNYQTSDLVTSSFKLYYTTTNLFATTTQLGSAQSIVATGNTITFSGISQVITTGTSGYLWLTADVAYNASTSRNISISSTSFSNITFATGTLSGSNPANAGNTQTFGLVAPSIAISQNGPNASNISNPATNAIIYGLSLAPTNNSTDFNSLTITTGGSYQISDLTASSIKLFYTTSNVFSSSVQLGTSQAVVASGNSVTFSGINQNILIGTTGYLWVTVDIEATAVASRTIFVTSTSFSNITFSAGTKTGTDPAIAGGTQTIVAAPSMTELVVPQYMFSKTASSTNTARAPMAICLQFNNLAPSQAYDIALQLELQGAVATNLGAGILWNGTAFNNSTITNSFTTSSNGNSGPVWFYIIATGNATRFDAAQIMNIRVAYVTNGGSMPTTPNFIGAKNITVLDIASPARTPSNSDDGAFITGTLPSSTSGKYVLLFNNENGTGDPIYSNQIISYSTTNTNTNLLNLPTSIYNVFSQTGTSAGQFAGIMPIGANNSNGVKRIEVRNLDNSIFAIFTSADGKWGSSADFTSITSRSVGTIDYTNVKNLTVNGDITLPSLTKVNGIVTINAGATLTTGGNLTLTSDANGTASIAQSAGTITGNVTVERYIPSTNGRGYKYLAAPFSAGPTIANSWQQQIYITGPGSGGTICPSPTAHTSTGFDATSNSNPSMFVFDETTATAGSNNYASTWTSIANTNATNLTAGTGYNVYVRGARSQGCGILVYPYTLTANAVTLSASGTVKTGSASLPVTYTAGNGDGWNLVGNPYPCEIDWDATSGWTKTNIDNAVYMYNPAGDNYASYTTLGAVSVNGGQRYIPSGTAFFVKANAVSPALACTEAVKTSTNATPFLKGNKPFSIHLNLSYSNGRTDESFVFLNQNLTDGFDNSYDIEKLANPSNVNIYSIDASHKQYAANAIANIADESDKILPLGIGDAYNGNYTLHLDAVDLPELHQVFLRDHYLNKVQQLPAGDSINYNFTVSNDSLSANNARFDLLIANKNKRSTGLNQLPALADVKVFPNPSKDIITVSMPASAQYVSSLVVYNVMGQMVKTIEHPKAEEQINLSELGAGMYFLSFVGNAQVLKTVKVCKN